MWGLTLLGNLGPLLGVNLLIWLGSRLP